MAIMRKDDSGDGTKINIGKTDTLLGPEAAFDGKLTFQGTVHLEGKFSGEIVSDDVLVVGETALVKADVHVGSLVLNGTIEGNVFAKSAVEIQAPGVLRGNLSTPSLTIGRGVVFEGTSHMEHLDKPPSTFVKKEMPPSLPEKKDEKKK